MVKVTALFGRAVLAEVRDLISAPFWWYTGGVVWLFNVLLDSLKDHWQSSALGVWLKNILVPMYGQTSFSGRAISFFMRLVNIIFRSLGLFIWLLILVAIFLLWLLLPIATLYFLVWSLTGFGK